MNRNRAVLPDLLAALVLALASVTWAQVTPVVQIPLAPTKIPQFVQPLPLPGGDIEAIVPNGGAVTLNTCEFQTTILPDNTLGKNIPAPKTWVWGYVKGAPSADCPTNKASYIGPVILNTRHTPTEVTYVNKLGTAATTNVLAYKTATDQTLMWADPLSAGVTNPGNPENNYCYEQAKMNPGLPPTGVCAGNYQGEIPAAPHLHGGEIPAALDGGPDAWWTATGIKGHGFYSKAGAANDAAIYRYPNGQEAAPIWFHDHTLGATRLNVYAGIAGGYVISDPANERADLPPLVPLVIQDRRFDTTGQLLLPNVGINPEHPFWIPEFVGDVIVVNGKAWPYLSVEPKRYRFLVLNGSNARAYELSLINKVTGVMGPALYTIATDQGYLDTPVKIDPNVKPNNKLVIMPGERYTVIVDFSAAAGQTLLLTNTAKTPYPAGAPVAGRTTGRVMQFNVSAAPVQDGSYNPATAAPGSLRVANRIARLADPLTGLYATTEAGTPITVHKVRRLTLNEVIAAGGPLEILMNNTPYTGEPRPDFEPIGTKWNTTHYSELPYEGETELWEIVNLTADAHPIHPHLVGFQLLNRQAFDLKAYDAAYNAAFPGGLYVPGYGPPGDYSCGSAQSPGEVACVYGGNPDVNPFLKGAPLPPLPSEAGWKDTVIAYPGQVTRMLIRFAPTHLPNDTLAADGFYDFDPNSGHGYVWHCHIIDHEDNEMMRPFSVVANTATTVQRKFVKGTDY
jgi:FtsP/CotA-like multicopper oxidase with cupredoxin domain